MKNVARNFQRSDLVDQSDYTLQDCYIIIWIEFLLWKPIYIFVFKLKIIQLVCRFVLVLDTTKLLGNAWYNVFTEIFQQ